MKRCAGDYPVRAEGLPPTFDVLILYIYQCIERSLELDKVAERVLILIHYCVHYTVLVVALKQFNFIIHSVELD